MDNIKYRHEYKYLIDSFQLEIIKDSLKTIMQPDTHAEGGTYTIRSLYFDSYDNKCYYENENGTSPREKCRIRIYNGSFDKINLEWKQRIYDKTHKESCSIKKGIIENLINGDYVKFEECDHPLMKKLFIRQETELFVPKIIVEYDRIPFVCPDGNVRITFDLNLRCDDVIKHFCDKNLSSCPVFPKSLQMMEVKYDDFLPDYIRKIIEDGKLKQTTFSKYYYSRYMGGLLK